MYSLHSHPSQEELKEENCKEKPPRRSTEDTQYTREPIQLNPDTGTLSFISNLFNYFISFRFYLSVSSSSFNINYSTETCSFL